MSPVPAGVDRRALAAVVDIFVGLVLLPTALRELAGLTLSGLWVGPAAWIAYEALAVAATGTTLGKRMVGLAVRAGDGDTLPPSRALLRAVVKVLGGTLIIGWLTGLGGRAVHDSAADSLVVTLDAPARSAPTASAAPAGPPQHPPAPSEVLGRRCYACGYFGDLGTFCAKCGAILAPNERQREIGETYLLNELPELIARDRLPLDVALRIRSRLVRERATPGAPPAGPVVADAAPAPVVIATPPRATPVPPAPAGAVAPSLDLSTPTLLLYVGAFLIVVSALIFVNVSGEQISDPAKLALMLIGTLGFLGAGILCHRMATVRPAGRTFLVIGALIAPLDFAAYYALVTRQSPLTSPALWLIGSLVCGGLYAALRLGGYGKGYSYLFLAALLSAGASTHAALDLRLAWWGVPFAFIVLSVEALRRAREPYTTLLLRPLRLAVSAIALLAVAWTLVPLAASAVADRWAAPVHTLLLTGYFVLRVRHGMRWERVIAHLGLAAVTLSVARALDADVRGLSAVLLVLAAAHGLAATSIRVLFALPWLPTEARWSSALLAAAAVVCSAAAAGPHWLDAAVLSGGAAVFAVLGTIRTGALTRATLQLLTLLGVLSGSLAYAEILTAAGVLSARTTLEALGVAYVPFALALASLAALAGGRPHAAPLAATAGLVVVLTVLATFSNAGLHTVATAAYATAAAVASVRAGPRALVGAHALATLAIFGMLRWSAAELLWWPVGLATVGAIAAPVALWRAAPSRWRDAALAIALSSFGVAAATGLVASAAGRALPWDTAVWWTTIVVLLAWGVFGWLASRQRRAGLGELASSVALPVAVEMIVAATHADLIEAYTLPLAAYAFALAVSFARRRAPRDAEIVAEYAGAALLLAPSLLQGWRTDDLARVLVGAVAGLLMLGFASAFRRERLARSAIAALLLVAARTADEPAAMAPYSAALGALVVGHAVLTARYAPGRLSASLLQAAEITGAALFVVATAMRAIDARDVWQPALLSVQALVLVAAGVAADRTALAAAGVATVAIAGAVITGRAAEREIIAQLLGALTLGCAALARPLRRRLTPELLAAMEVIGAMVLLAPTVRLSLEPDPGGAARAAAATAGAAVFVAAGLLWGRLWLAGAGLLVIAVEGLVALGAPSARQWIAVGAGLYLVALGISVSRGRLPEPAREWIHYLEAMGLTLFLLPTFLLTFGRDAAWQTALLLAQLVGVLVTGAVLRRRWYVVVSLAVLGIEALRALGDVVNRLPNWASFGLAGLLLLVVGFVLLADRERWSRWRATFDQWWGAQPPRS